MLDSVETKCLNRLAASISFIAVLAHKSSSATSILDLFFWGLILEFSTFLLVFMLILLPIN